MARKRKHLVESAGYWFNGARKHQEKGELAAALMCMENAYNHVENAFAACTTPIKIQNAMRVLCHALGDHKLRFVGGDLVELDEVIMRTQDATDKIAGLSLT